MSQIRKIVPISSKDEMRSWIQLALQTVVLIIAFGSYAVTNEHRLTIIEETLKTNREILAQLGDNQIKLTEAIRELQILNERLTTEMNFVNKKGK